MESHVPKPGKPLGRSAYGSIPHLPGSRLGPGDWHVHEGQARIVCERARDGRDRITVTEKLDGSNVGLLRREGRLIALTRAGYRAEDSRFEQHHHFARWAAAREGRLLAALAEGERMAGEWLLQAHGLRYEIASPEELFVAFDILAPAPARRGGGDRRLPRAEFLLRCAEAGVPTAALISDGPALSIEEALIRLGARGRHRALGPPEGAVWRCERDGEVDFLAKFVRHDKADGVLLPEISGHPPVWNWPPDAL